jgi:hypothetical protein
MLKFSLVTCQSSSVDADGFWGVQSDAHSSTVTDLSANSKGAGLGHFWMQHSFGFIARPVDPDNDNGKGCLLLEGTEGSSEGFSWLAHDPRFYSVIPALTQGSSCMYNSRGMFLFLDSEAETLTQYIPYTDGTAKKSHVVTYGKDANGSPSIELRHGNGQYISMVDEKIVLRAKGNASLELDGDNVIANGNLNNPGAGSFGGATPVNTLVTLPGFEVFIQAFATALQPLLTPTPGAPIGTAIATAMNAALAATTAALGTKLLTAL